MIPVERAAVVDSKKEIVRRRLVAPAIEVRVAGKPAPQGSKVPKGRAGNGRILMVESSKYVEPWREAVKMAAQRAAGVDSLGALEPRFPLDGALMGLAVFTVAKPQAAPKKRRTYPASRRNDASKLLRSSEDALKDAGIIVDDGLFVEYIKLAKVYPGEDVDALGYPGAVFQVWSLDLIDEDYADNLLNGVCPLPLDAGFSMGSVLS